MILDIIKIACLMLLCVYTSITDIRHNTVQNKVILAAFITGALLNTVGWIFFDSAAVIKQLLSILVIFVVAAALYLSRVWAGGDCKLIFAVSLFVPASVYISCSPEWLSLLPMLAVAFALSYIFLLFDSLYHAVKKKDRPDKGRFARKLKAAVIGWISCTAYILTADSIIFYFYSAVPRTVVFAVNICIALIISGFPALMNKKAVAVVLVVGAVLKIVLNGITVNKFVLISYLFVFLFIVLRLFIDGYNYMTIDTSQVKKGMILSAASTMQFVRSNVKGLPKISTENLKSRLTEDEASAVRRWEKSKYGAPTVQIVRKIPFAIFISAGAVFYIILGVLLNDY